MSASASVEAPVANRKGSSKPADDDRKSSRVIFLATEDWVARMTEAAESLGLSLAAFIRMSCEEKSRRLDGRPSGD